MPHVTSLLVCTAFIAYPALSGSCFYDFHENCFLTPALLWVIYGMEKRNLGLVLAASVLTWSIKEDTGIYTAFLGLYFWISAERKREGLGLFLASCFAFLVVNSYLGRSEFGVADMRYENLVLDKSGSMYQILSTAWYHAAYLLQQCLDLERVWYLLLMLFPFLMGLAGIRNWSCLILTGPMILLNLMPGYAYMHTLNYQYNFGNTALLFYLFLVLLKEKKKEDQLRFCAACAAVCVVMVSGLKLVKLEETKKWWENRREYAHLESVLSAVPSEASVIASTYLVPHFYQHEELYPVSSGIACDYLVLDKSRPASQTEERLLETGEYEPWYLEEGMVEIYQRVRGKN